MSFSRGLSDTSAEAERVLVDLARSMSPAKRLAIACAMSRSLRELAEIGVRERHPNASGAEIRQRLAEIVLGSEIAHRVVGSPPARGT